ncbi:nucleoside hydrolase [Sinobaca sp. H24]|uniref:nucleoside hydrolase n=1 Tax=Sinobaca sp. H24 TaxID=2923376 RepID=UPI00207953AB|nr:nucleoside hydrolase [Sinobaca sp. H24]
MAAKKVWLDVDTGVDDALGLLLACGSPELDIQAVSVTHGNVSVDQATANTLQVLDTAGRSDIPVYKGAARPLLRRPLYEHAVHGKDGISGISEERYLKQKPDAGYAPERLVDLIYTYPHELTLIFTGPLTNLALALHQAPAAADLIHEVIFMGGVVHGPGNITPAAEFNTYVDPEAVQVVLQSGISRLTQVGLDVTKQALLSEDRLQKLKQRRPFWGHWIESITKQYRERYFTVNGVHACALHDPLAVAAALDPKLLETIHAYTEIECRSSISDGCLVVDEKNRLKKTPNAYIAMGVDLPLFFSLFEKAVDQLPDRKEPIQ